MDEVKNYRTLAHRDIYSGRVISVVVDDIEYDSGMKSVREVARHPGGAVMVGLFPDETILLVRQFRFAVNEWLWELPAGKLDHGEDPQAAAVREFREETGYTAKDVKKLMRIYSSPGFCTEILHIYLATGLESSAGGQELEEGEQSITVHRIALSKAVEMVEKGEITDAKTVCGILLVERNLHP